MQSATLMIGKISCRIKNLVGQTESFEQRIKRAIHGAAKQIKYRGKVENTRKAMIPETASSEEIQRLLSFTRQTKGTKQNSRICYDWKHSGFCRHGNSCRFLHEAQNAYTPLNYHNRIWSHAQASTSGTNGTTSTYPKKDWNFSLMSYNVLADKLAHEHARELYRAVPALCLDWKPRLSQMLEELKFLKPDVICLQEVDHVDDFLTALEPLGYAHKSAPRTGDRSDGCLTLWKRNKFAFVRSDVLEMAAYNLRDNVALFVTLVPEGDKISQELDQGKKDLSPSEIFTARGPPIVIANTHLLFNPKRGDIKLGQSRLILNRIVEICKQINMPPAAIFCGDFNSKPESAIYSFVREGELDCFMEDRRVLSGQLENEGKGWPTVGRPTPAQMMRLRPRGNSMDCPANPFILARQREASGSPQPRHLASPSSRAHTSGQFSTPPAPKPLRMGESFTSVGLGEQERGASLSDPRRSGPVCLPGQGPMYPHTDKFGQVAWSRVPPTHGQFKRQPFYHEPMRVEEAEPTTPPPPPAGIVRTVSFADRQMNAQTWSVEQLMVATGINVENGVVPNTDGKGGSKLPPPSAQDLWIAEHPLPMQSSYATLLGAEPEFTTCHSKFIGTVDYIWFTPEAGAVKLKPSRALLPPPLESLHCGLPSPEWPSDHISLLVDFHLSVD